MWEKKTIGTPDSFGDWGIKKRMGHIVRGHTVWFEGKVIGNRQKWNDPIYDKNLQFFSKDILDWLEVN